MDNACGPAALAHELAGAMLAAVKATRGGKPTSATWTQDVFARNQVSADSGVDLLVDFEPGREHYDAWLALADHLQAALGRRVDLVTLEGLGSVIVPYILAESVDVLRSA